MHSSSHASTSSIPAGPPPSLVKRHHAYFTEQEVLLMTEKQRGKLTAKAEEKARQTACGFAESVGGRLGFPRRTIATAQTLFHRFHLFFALKDFVYHDVIVSSLYVACKMHDTLKKPRDILLASYSIRFPEKANKGKGPAGGGMGTGVVGEGDIDPALLEQDRLKLLSIERLLLETVCFNFKVHMPFSYVVKFAKALGASKQVAQSAWRISVDSNRTLAPLLHPPHTVALASIYLASLLGSLTSQLPAPDSAEESIDPVGTERAGCVALSEVLGSKGGWEGRFKGEVGGLEAITHSLLDLFIFVLSDLSPPSITSSSSNPHQSPISDPDLSLSSSSNPSSSINATNAAAAQLCTPLWGKFQASDLTQLKIELHQKAAGRKGNANATAGGKRKAEEEEVVGGKRKSDPSVGYGVKVGKKASKDVWGGEGGRREVGEGSTRFLFD
ncbi:cyclin-like protein [Mrakia frigida]|uniref:Ctk2p n=1 Tax=Mrakia frigida TaxID=29902 RepID=UPI003FCC167A